MKKLFIILAFIIGTVTNALAQNTDSLSNRASAVKIRGTKKPVYSIDGIKQSAYSDFSITSLKPETIQEIQILKSEDAIKLYGVEAIGGAVLIITKSGKSNAGNVELQNKLTMLNLNKAISSFKDLKFTPKNSNQTDSSKLNNQSRIIFRGLDYPLNNTNEPIYVLDGDKVEKDSINLLNPQSIESVTILKKNNATALYGVQALNGVVIITTKKPIPKAIEKGLDKN